MKDLNEFEKLIQTLKQIEQIEPPSNFEYRVMREVEKIESPVGLRERIYQLLIRNPQGVYPEARGAIRHLVTTRYAPAWAISAAIHLIIFAALALVLIQPTQRQIIENYQIKFMPADSKERVFDPTESGLPSLTNQKIPPSKITDSDTVGQGTEVLPPEVTEPITDQPPEKVVEPVFPPSIWKNKLPPLVNLDSIAEKRFVEHISSGRQAYKRPELLAKYGGDASTERAVSQGLKWLEHSQESDGSWNPEKYGGVKDYTVGLTALSLLTYLNDGSNSKSGSHQKVIAAGIKYLLANQQANGLFGPSYLGGKPINYMYNHGIAALSVLENYCATQDKEDESSVRKAVYFILASQNPEGGWGYQSHNGVNDTSVTVWQITALRVARALEIKGVAESIKKASHWLASVTNEAGQVGYRKINNYPNGHNALTAAGMFAQLFIGWDKEDALIEKQAKLLTNTLPKMHPTGEELDNDFYYWYFGTLAMKEVGGESWKTWNKHLKETLVKAQIPNSKVGGSWEPVDRWSTHGGRLYTTSMAILTLQVYYRYPTTEG